jgi:predicted alpha/beta hydrolase family esterase
MFIFSLNLSIYDLARSLQSKFSKSLIHLHHSLWTIIVILTLSACHYNPFNNQTDTPSATQLSPQIYTHTIKLNEISLDLVKEAGKVLIERPYGLHPIQLQSQEMNKDTKKQEIIIFVHGYESRGYEWIYPIHHTHKLSQEKVQRSLFFYRWDWKQCPTPAAEDLVKHIEKLAQYYPQASFKILAHSYGGVILLHMLNLYTSNQLIQAHTIASPLAGHPSLSTRCPFTQNLQFNESKIHFYQWRTQKHLDSAFKNLKKDPQNLKLPGKIKILPDRYKQYRLGHNRSISWVIEQPAIGL